MLAEGVLTKSKAFNGNLPKKASPLNLVDISIKVF